MTRSLSVDELKNIPFFYDMAEEDLAVLVDFMEIREQSASRYIFKEGDETDSVYFIIAGAVKVVKKISKDNEELLSTIEATNFFGDLALISGGRRFASVVTITDFVGAKLTAEKFNLLMNQFPQIALNIIRKIALITSLKLRKSSNNREGLI